MQRTIYVNGRLATYASTAELETVIKREVRLVRTTHSPKIHGERKKPPRKVLSFSRC